MSISETQLQDKQRAAHTPGPWRLDDDGRGIIGEGEVGVGKAFAWQPNNAARPRTADEEAANARLLVAAPMLLAAVKGLLNDIDTGLLVRDITRDGDPNWSREILAFVQRLQQAQAAVLAAEGRQ